MEVRGGGGVRKTGGRVGEDGGWRSRGGGVEGGRRGGRGERWVEVEEGRSRGDRGVFFGRKRRGNGGGKGRGGKRGLRGTEVGVGVRQWEGEGGGGGGVERAVGALRGGLWSVERGVCLN